MSVTDPWAAFAQPAADEQLRLLLQPGREAVRPVYQRVCELLASRTDPTSEMAVSDRVGEYDVTITVCPRRHGSATNAELQAHLDEIVARALRVMFLDHGRGRTEYSSSKPGGGNVAVYVHHASFTGNREGPAQAVEVLAG